LWSGCVSHLLERWVSPADTTPMKQDVATTARATPHSPKSDLSMNVKPSRTPVLDPPTFTAESAPPLSIGEQIQHARNFASRKPGATVICMRNHGPVAGLVIGTSLIRRHLSRVRRLLFCAPLVSGQRAAAVIERRRGHCGHPSRVCSVLSLTLLMVHFRLPFYQAMPPPTMRQVDTGRTRSVTFANLLRQLYRCGLARERIRHFMEQRARGVISL